MMIKYYIYLYIFNRTFFNFVHKLMNTDYNFRFNQNGVNFPRTNSPLAFPESEFHPTEVNKEWQAFHTSDTLKLFIINKKK